MLHRCVVMIEERRFMVLWIESLRPTKRRRKAISRRGCEEEIQNAMRWAILVWLSNTKTWRIEESRKRRHSFRLHGSPRPMTKTGADLSMMSVKLKEAIGWRDGKPEKKSNCFWELFGWDHPDVHLISPSFWRNKRSQPRHAQCAGFECKWTLGKFKWPVSFTVSNSSLGLRKWVFTMRPFARLLFTIPTVVLFVEVFVHFIH